MQAHAVVMEKPEELAIRQLDLAVPGDDDIVVDVAWSGISTGTERLLWSGQMPSFPGMGYPLVPGYESVGQVVAAGPNSGFSGGETVFVPGSKGFRDVRGLFGGAASRVVTAGERAIILEDGLLGDGLGQEAVLLALAATGYRALVSGNAPELIVGHGVLGRLIARLSLALGNEPPTVWETNPVRQSDGEGYAVVHPDADARRDYATICDVSGDAAILDSVIPRLGAGGEIVLAGFYAAPLQFAFPPAFMREARIRISAEWKPSDLHGVKALISEGRLSLDGLITHRCAAADASSAYETAFGDAACLKMILDWRDDS